MKGDSLTQDKTKRSIFTGGSFLVPKKEYFRDTQSEYKLTELRILWTLNTILYSSHNGGIGELLTIMQALCDTDNS